MQAVVDDPHHNKWLVMVGSAIPAWIDAACPEFAVLKEPGGMLQCGPLTLR